MTQAEFEARLDPVRHILGYFNQQVLASYRNESDKYLIETDSFDGTLTLTESYLATLLSEQSQAEYFRIRFGYRTLASGELALAVVLDDLHKAPGHLKKWQGFLIEEQQWISDEDSRFDKWVLRYIGGSWEVDCDPKQKLIEVMATINALTIEVLEVPFFKHVVHESLSFPAAENTHEYQDAHVPLYGYIIDGIDKQCLELLSKRLSERPVDIESSKTLDAVKRILPTLKENTNFSKAMSLVSEQRRFATHGVRAPAQPFSAFTMFTSDLELCVEGCAELLTALESSLGADGPAAKHRHDAKTSLLKIAGPVHAFASLHQSKEMEGKTIERVEYGKRETFEEIHDSECLNIYFVDGSILQIDTGSNVNNLCSDRSDLIQNEFHVDFILSWVPALDVDK